jgi:hypothetical protein
MLIGQNGRLLRFARPAYRPRRREGSPRTRRSVAWRIPAYRARCGPGRCFDRESGTAAAIAAVGYPTSATGAHAGLVEVPRPRRRGRSTTPDPPTCKTAMRCSVECQGAVEAYTDSIERMRAALHREGVRIAFLVGWPPDPSKRLLSAAYLTWLASHREYRPCGVCAQ